MKWSRNKRDFVAALAQRRNLDVEHVEPVVQVGPEFALFDPLGQIAVGGGDHADVGGRLHAIGADAPDLAVLEKAEHESLHAQTGLADFVEEDGAAVGEFQQAGLVAVCTGEAAPHMTEQLRLEQRIGNCGAVERDQLDVAAAALLMNEPGHDFLTDTALAREENFGVRTGGVVDFTFELPRNLGCSNQCFCRHECASLREAVLFPAHKHARTSAAQPVSEPQPRDAFPSPGISVSDRRTA